MRASATMSPNELPEEILAVPRDGARVLIAGGGVAALEAALALEANAEERADVELLAPEPWFWYRPLAVAEPFGLGETTHFDLADLAAAAGASFTLGALRSVDASRRLAHTAAGSEIRYDALLIACGAVPHEAVPGALMFRGPADTTKVQEVLSDVAAGKVRSLVFAVPARVVWGLPAYELALMAASWVEARKLDGVEVALVTPEETPLGAFGREASEAVRQLLEARGVVLHTGTYPVEVRGGELHCKPASAISADRVIALPQLRGPRIDGIPQTAEGFVPVDRHGCVVGVADVYAAGDVTTFPVKQGGIAAQQADAAAEAIAAALVGNLEPAPFRPVLRGLLLTGAEPRYLRHELTGGSGETSTVSPEPLWWPPAKIVGKYLAPFLGTFAHVEVADEASTVSSGLPVHVELNANSEEATEQLEPADEGGGPDEDGAVVGDVMRVDVLVVAPDDRLGDTAARMREREVGCALVVSEERLVGILTSRDLLRAVAARTHPGEDPICYWMTADPVTASVTTTLAAALQLMTERGVRRLPVVAGRRPVGMIGWQDASRAAQPRTGLGLGL